MNQHLPVVTRRRDGQWGVWCLACSDREQDYIYPCEAQAEDGDWPPEVLVEPDVAP